MVNNLESTFGTVWKLPILIMCHPPDEKKKKNPKPLKWSIPVWSSPCTSVRPFFCQQFPFGSLNSYSCLAAKLYLILCKPMDCKPARLPCPWGSPGKNIGVGCHFLLQGIFPIQGSNPRLLHSQQDSFHWANREACPERWPCYNKGSSVQWPRLLGPRCLVEMHFSHLPN